MAKIHQNLIAVLWVTFLALATVANTTAGVIACLPKACCCTTAMPHSTDHQETMTMQMPVKKGCSPHTPAPCCQVEPYPPSPAMALNTAPNNVPHRSICPGTMADDSASPMEIPHQNLKPFRDHGQSNIPWIPIWLQTLSILC